MSKKGLLVGIIFCIISIIMLSVLMCHAEMNITLIWEYDNPQLISGYKIYYSQVSGQYDPNNPIDIIEDPNVMISNIVLPDGIYYFVATAFKDNGFYGESERSNEATNLVAPKLKKCLGF